MNLNPEQEKAKKQINGPVLILAGAGSGKTATLTARIEYMIKEAQIAPHNILAVTFTNKAAREMKERIGRVLGVEYQINPFKNRGLPAVGTFHGIGVMILKEKIDTIGMNKDFVIYDTSDQASILKSIIKDELKLDEKKYPVRMIGSFISNAKNALITAEKYHLYIDSHIKEIVNNAYKIYQNRLNENNALDFDDILVKTLQILQIPENLEFYQERFKYIMVDEYQDTNAPQYEIVKLLASKYRNLAVVGDDWQSIYSWRGADMKNIINFKKDYPEALVIKLEQNYRSTKYIIDAANQVIKNNKTALDKTLFTNNELGEQITYIDAPDDRIESKVITSIIKEKGGQYSDNLILYRTNSQSRSLEEALMMNGVPYRVVGGLKFYDRMEVKDILAYLKVILNPNDAVGLKRIINTPTRKIGATTISKLDDYKNNFGVSYIQILENVEEIDELNSGAKRAITGFYETITDLMEASKRLVVGDLIDYIIERIRYEEYLKDDSSRDEYEARIENLKELKNVATTYNGMDPRDSLNQFLEEVALLTDLDNKDKDLQDVVTLMTIHTSKGLEYNRVFITGLEEGLFPSSRSMNEPSDLEEERRLMYVAMTRAKKELFISRAQERFQYGEYVRNPESRFLSEISSDFIQNYDMSSFGFNKIFGNTAYEIQEHVKNPFKVKKTIVENDVSDFSVGDKLTHPKFGTGFITSMTNDLAEIAFAGYGIKKMNIKIAPVKKI